MIQLKPWKVFPQDGSDADKAFHSCLDRYAKVRIVWRQRGYWVGQTLFGRGVGDFWVHVQGPKLGNMFLGRYSIGDHCEFTLRNDADPFWQTEEASIRYDPDKDDAVKEYEEDFEDRDD